jgi:hypothetical protein
MLKKPTSDGGLAHEAREPAGFTCVFGLFGLFG